MAASSSPDDVVVPGRKVPEVRVLPDADDVLDAESGPGGRRRFKPIGRATPRREVRGSQRVPPAADRLEQ
jgi:hypothetical protein